MLHRIQYPPLSTIKHLEGTGNFAVSKYYKWPFRPFYRHKFKMIVDLIGDSKFNTLLDFGSGSGIFVGELERHSRRVVAADKYTHFDVPRRFDAIVCASVLEFCHLYSITGLLHRLLNPGGVLFVASPMDTGITQSYFRLIGNKNLRHSHKLIKTVLQTRFKIEEYKEWMGMYFALKATRL